MNQPNPVAPTTDVASSPNVAEATARSRNPLLLGLGLGGGTIGVVGAAASGIETYLRGDIAGAAIAGFGVLTLAAVAILCARGLLARRQF